ncbi:hypothetical protein KY348_05770 [Candidatus Woesearchaeota archaeon]|nr:hypothetical protein [Candidatus Woesearchaeota archaeon]
MIIHKISNRIKKYSAIAAACALLKAFTPSVVNADDISKGMRGPTNWQIDERVFYLKNQQGLESLTNTLFFKCWDNTKWGFAIASYKWGSSGKGTTDITLGGGPQFTSGNFYFLPYAAITLPTGELSNQRFDEKIGVLATYLNDNKKFEVDLALQYAFTGKNNQGINPPNELYVGMVSGGKLTSKIRGVAGVTVLRKDNSDYLLNLRSVLRYTFSRAVHIELVGDMSISSNNIPKKKDVGLQLRWNF